MTFGKALRELRQEAGLSEEQFARLFSLPCSKIGEWERETEIPTAEEITVIAAVFGEMLTARIEETADRLIPRYDMLHVWEYYAQELEIEYRQCLEEGLDMQANHDLFLAIAALPKGEMKTRLADALFRLIRRAPKQAGYAYVEPSGLAEIQALRKPYAYSSVAGDWEQKIHGAWFGRVCGCMLGKPIEGIHTEQLTPFLKETKNYPLHRYILRSDLTDTITSTYTFPFARRQYVDDGIGMPSDDDTNYMVLYQEIVQRYGRDFTPHNVAQAWLDFQPKGAYCTAERVAFCNFVKGYRPPESAMYQNPYREWIGAQIRGDYFGYINPGNPTLAAEMAWRDASISHVKNGIYGEMWVAAMIAIAAVTTNLSDIIRGGLAEIPHTSRLYEQVTAVLSQYENGMSQEDCFAYIHQLFNEHYAHDWCHTISNAMIVAASLLYGGGDYGRSICMAVQAGFDTDCNGATVGSILGMRGGVEAIPAAWRDPMHDTLHTDIFGIDTVKISDRARMTLQHL